MLRDDHGNYFATIEKAKFFEHKKHDMQKAIEIVNEALNHPSFKTISERNALEHRITRLKSRTVTRESP
jgi:Txe/YoeB family toxin of Txe-Axe toxin-antitoxin module